MGEAPIGFHERRLPFYGGVRYALPLLLLEIALQLFQGVWR